MPSLLHHPLDPASRLIRLMCAEYGVPLDMEEIKPWLRTPELLEVNPAATLPILIDDNDQSVIGLLANIHTIEALYAPSAVAGLMPDDAIVRAEMWRLIEWVISKLNDEVTRYVLEEKIVKRDHRGATPDPAVLRVAKANLNEHMLYFNWLFANRSWLTGDDMTLADFALAAHLSTLDYLGDIDWGKAGETRDWYSRIKSRPAFRTLLNDRVLAMPPHQGYADLDF
ncbi:glutathione S-transferase family protein [Devosia sp. J2-20]|jgi:glutathione S-transferase|uniref:Glutathione S-transferase family protein n=1 Tax=Devosia litorisediminis TaxID=2829817 RepID=A0A942EDZ4_9HYPH|nr:MULTISPECIES: glutathione S-transferase family protein [Devosia]MBS3850512.1 glutathione S-transferase family protein [Devosia litorisediminis]MCZ4347826.1 glutathione S-transferase family protein [Devosia neptuniae]WDR00247.1 glutathione S-transferase family protein [Devosia sp. J2-20]|tara:strand:- start:524 stop:1201 length:678 start_codon:yes stop_codon:yes gene_type:complete